MLPKKYRLPTNDIPQLAKRGKLMKGDLFDVRKWYDDSLENPQFGISISKSIDKRATVRNLIKRKLRAAIQQLLNDDFDKKAKYLIIVRSADIAETNLEDLVSNLGSQF